MSTRAPWLRTAGICLLAVVLAACAKSNQQSGQQSGQANSTAAAAGSHAAPATSSSAPAAESQGAPSPKTSASSSPASAQPATAPATQAPAPAPVQPTTLTLPAGTLVHVRLNDTLDSGETDAGTRFSGTLSRPLRVNGMEVAPAGSTVSGRVTNAVSSGRLSRPGELALVLTAITPPAGSPISIRTHIVSFKGQSHKGHDAKVIGGVAGLGALIGGIAGHGGGAAIGALAGGGAGTAAAAATGKHEIHLAAETALTFRLSRPVSVTQAPSE